MAKFIIKRLLFILPTILGISFIVFFVMDLTPGSPALLILGETASPEQIAALNEELGYNRPFLVRYLDYILSALQGDFGNSYSSGQPVMELILTKFPVTAKLAIFGVLLGSVVGISLGILSAVKQYSILDGISSVLAITVASVPTFWLGLMALLLFASKLDWLPSYGLDTPLHYVLPVFVVSLSCMANTLRMTRTTMLEAIRQDYVRTAKAKGASRKTVIFKHALQNALLPVVTQVGIDFGYLLGGTVVVERIFTINGIGTLVITAVNDKDIPIVMGVVIFLSLLFMLILLAVDILYAYIDPRVKARYLANQKSSRKRGASAA